MKNILRRLGILTGGGDCPGLNAAIRMVTKSAVLASDAWVIGFEDGFAGLTENRFSVLDYESVSGLLTRGGTILGTSNKADPFHYRLSGENAPRDASRMALRHYRSHRLDALFVIGGDGTMSIAHGLSRLGMKIVGIPKTIDNDLMHSDHTIGFATAVTTATDAIDKIHSTAESHHRVMLIEIMGRNAGWLALESGLAGGGDIIVIPEIPYRLERLAEFALFRSRKGKSFTIVVVAEGARPRGGDKTIARLEKDSPDPVRLGGVANKLAQDLERTTGLPCRATILGHLLRGGVPVPADRVLASLCAQEAVRLAGAGRFGRVVVSCRGNLSSVALSQVANRQRLVPPTHPLIRAARAVGTVFG